MLLQNDADGAIFLSILLCSFFLYTFSFYILFFAEHFYKVKVGFFSVVKCKRWYLLPNSTAKYKYYFVEQKEKE